MCVVSLCGKLSEEIDFEVRKKKFGEKKKGLPPLNRLLALVREQESQLPTSKKSITLY